MGNLAVRTEGLSKAYRIGSLQDNNRTFREVLSSALVSPFVRTGNLLRGQSYGAAGLSETIWALKDVSFEIKHGEVVGIIGSNGAGKSTLLKVLSRITDPTEGYVDLYGRVGALLEVGTGFHQELTGRENVYLNGAILGMSRDEIDRKFDEIVDFAGVEKFIDTPVKYYSSGMGLRLGFAVAAHLEPEILIVDEVLAVGDADFQKKCLGKMSDVASEGRTVLFVSHNMAAVENLCQRGIVLNQGQIQYDGSQTDAIMFYFQKMNDAGMGDSLLDRRDREGNGVVRFSNLHFQDRSGHPIDTLASGDDIDICMSFITSQPIANQKINAGLSFYNSLGVPIFSQSTRVMHAELTSLPEEGMLVCRIPRLPLPPSTYYVSINVKVDEVYADYIINATQVTVAEGNFFGTGRMFSSNLGVCLVDGAWRVEQP